MFHKAVPSDTRNRSILYTCWSLIFIK